MIMDKQNIGSMTAKGGFANEEDIKNKFLNWQSDTDAQKWLMQMGYRIEEIRVLESQVVPTSISWNRASDFGISDDNFIETKQFKKADLRVNIKTRLDSIVHTENISLKKANFDHSLNRPNDYNQVDKRPVDTYRNMWSFNDNVSDWLKLFTGEYEPKNFRDRINYGKLKNAKRIFLNEIPETELWEIVDFFSKNKTSIIRDVLKGRGVLDSDWMLVTENVKADAQCEDGCHPKWVLRAMDYVLDYYSEGVVELSKFGSLTIGKITMQRKGGTPDPTSLQFKFHPLELFDN